MITDKTLEERLLQTFDFLPHCEPQIYDEFLRAAFPVKLQKDQFICQEGGECSHLALVLSGTARIYKLGETGREITLYRVGTGQSCVLTASCIQAHQAFPAFAVCEQDIEAILVPAATVNRWLAESAPWRDYFFSLVARRMANIISLVDEVVFQRMDRRIAAYLAKNAAATTNTLHATHREIASDLGTSREVVSRILKDFEASGLIEASRGTIHIRDPHGLNQKGTEPYL